MLRGMGPRYPLQPLSEQSLVPTREGWVLGKGTARFPSLAGVQGWNPLPGVWGWNPRILWVGWVAGNGYRPGEAETLTIAVPCDSMDEGLHNISIRLGPGASPSPETR